MLLEFRAKNFKSFKNEFVFSMIPAPKQKGLDYSILKEDIENNVVKALPTSVIYGTNSSGKTTIISAMEVLKNIILRGNIRNPQSQSKGKNIVMDLLELIPNTSNDIKDTVDFGIKFIENKHLFEYKLSLSLGKFATTNFDRKIVKEEFNFDSKQIFSREETTIKFYKVNTIKDFLLKEIDDNINVLQDISKKTINKEELFLTNGFKSMFSQQLVDMIINWNLKKFNPIFMSNDLLDSPEYNKEKTKIFESKLVNQIAREMGSCNKIVYYNDNKDSIPKMVSVIEKSKFALPSIFIESYGTFRFLNTFPVIKKILSNGGILIIDEFDNSLHPNVVMNIIKIFHNDAINKNKAQLVFNTHNPIFLNSNLFRRDEIKFVEKNDETNESELYSLSDFGTDGKDGVRKGEDYMKNYFINKYGAIKDIDFTSIFKKFVSGENDNDK